MTTVNLKHAAFFTLFGILLSQCANTSTELEALKNETKPSSVAICPLPPAKDEAKTDSAQK